MAADDRPFAIEQPDRRPLKIFAFDPTRGRTLGNRTSITVPYEPLAPGPVGARIRVVDFDLTTDCYYPPVDLEDRRVLLQGGLEPAEADPRFHQQMAYAVTMKTIETFERALGRRLSLTRRKRRNGGTVAAPLLVLPHAFQGENAFYDPNSHALLFGYFTASRDAKGMNLPGQVVHTCLSHDILVHETSHALLHRLRKRFLLAPTHADVLAFHEGFADIVAIFQHFAYRDVVADQLRRFPGGFDAKSWMATLAEQFGYARGEDRALRTAYVGDDVRLDDVLEPHDRGGVLVAAVFDAFFDIYNRRTQDLIRIATGGTGRLPAGDISPDLAGRLGSTAAATAQQMLNMCIRAVEYLPPVDVRFSDYLRALVTADVELAPHDDDGRREAMIIAFRKRGILPIEAVSLAEEALVLPRPAYPLQLQDSEYATLAELLQDAASRVETDDDGDDEPDGGAAPRGGPGAHARMAILLHAFADRNRAGLLLHPKEKIVVDGLHTSYRVGQDGQIRFELIAQFVQKSTLESDDFGGVVLHGGTTIVVSAGGEVRYVIAKPLGAGDDAVAHVGESGPARRAAAAAFVRHADRTDPKTPYLEKSAFQLRMRARASLASLHSRAGAS